MDKDTAKQILAAYRPNGADAADDSFREALAAAERDPELAEWFRGETGFDRRMAAALESIPVHQSEKEALVSLLALEDHRHRGPSRFRLFRGKTLALAALFVAGVGASLLWWTRGPAAPPVLTEANFSVAAVAEAALPFDHRSESLPEIRDWLAGQGAPVPAELPARFERLATNGCRVFALDGGGRISLLCFRDGRSLVHLLVFDPEARRFLDDDGRGWRNEDGWHVRRLDGPDADGALVLATRSDPRDLDPGLWL
jgi:hypothetical protein